MKVQKNKVRNLVFKGGSAKGIAYHGCLTQLEKVGVNLSRVKQVIGTSAGALTALFVALNLYEDSDKLRDLFDKDFTEFLDPGNEALKTGILKFAEANILKKFMTATTALSEYYSSSEYGTNLGFVSGDSFKDWVEQLIQFETGIENCTFNELGQFKKFKSLFVVATDLSTSGPLIYSKNKTPNAIISDSIRSSTSIPLLFVPHKFYCKNMETGIREIPEEFENHWLVDGAAVLNYPIKVFDELTNPALPDETLGFYLTNGEQIEKYLQKFPPPKRKFPELNNNTNSIFPNFTGGEWIDFFNNWNDGSGSSYSSAVYATYEHGQGAAHAMYEKEFDRTIYVDNLKISSLKFGLSQIEKIALFEEGRKAVNAYFGEGRTSRASTESR